MCDTTKMSVSALNNGVFESANTSNGVAIQSDLGFAFHASYAIVLAVKKNVLVSDVPASVRKPIMGNGRRRNSVLVYFFIATHLNCQ